MELNEIESYLSVSRAHSICVHVCEIKGAPGYLRTIVIHKDNTVSIEFDTCQRYINQDWEGGGLKYIAQYQSLPQLIEDLEVFIGQDMKFWRNYSKIPLTPKCLLEPDAEKCMGYFEKKVREKSINLPRKANFEIAGVYWRHIAKFGRFRPEKMIEEQEEEISKELEEE